MNERRRFLKVIGGAALAASLPACTGSDPTTSSSSGGAVGVPGNGSPKVADVLPGTLVRGPGDSLVGRDGGGLYAMTSLCTHNQCDLKIYGLLSANGVMCGCHSSKYTLDGTRVSGPAPASLAHLKLTVNADKTISVDPNEKVDASVRTPVA
jgi:Rieske Fe-S protein